jgi:hypothetical protein
MSPGADADPVEEKDNGVKDYFCQFQEVLAPLFALLNIRTVVSRFILRSGHETILH